MSDETVRTIWIGLSGFFIYAIGFAQAMVMVWWKASSETRQVKKVQRTMLANNRSTVYSG